VADAILEAREARWAKRLALASAMGPDGVLLTSTLRMPSSLRASGAYDGRARRIFDDLAERARAAGFTLVDSDFRVRADGPEGYLSLAGDARAAKELAIVFEESHPWGELVDVDAMDSKGRTLCRSDLGLPPRRCLVCGGEATLCVVERRHGMEELRAKVEEILARPAKREPADASICDE
jgi:holo-ACP synthase CitX